MVQGFYRQFRGGATPAKATIIILAGLMCRMALSQIVQPDLDYTSLEPYISDETLSYHYGAHHAGYVSNLNAFIDADESLQDKSLEYIMLNTEGTIFNNAGQVWNHNFYWDSMSDTGGGEPDGDLYDDIVDSFGSYEYFVSNFTSVASGHFGSGWAWLVQNSKGCLEVVDTHDASNPVVEDTGTPLLTCDVWEHAYYIDQRNVRSDYIEAWWNLVNWDFAKENYVSSGRRGSRDLTSKSCK